MFLGLTSMLGGTVSKLCLSQQSGQAPYLSSDFNLFDLLIFFFICI